MTAKIIDGKAYADGLRERIAGHVARLKAEHGITPGLAVVIVGHDPGSQIYVPNKAKQTVEVGMHSEKYELPRTPRRPRCWRWSKSSTPIPPSTASWCNCRCPSTSIPTRSSPPSRRPRTSTASPPTSVGKLQIGLPGPVSCTPLGCLMLLRDFVGDLAGQARRHRRPLQSRRQADGAIAAARKLHRHHRAFPDDAISPASCGRPISSSPPSAARR